ncbi:hypothetical protein CR513_16697, partial [Mucuna pruriens]
MRPPLKGAQLTPLTKDKKRDKWFSRFLEIFKQLHINIHFFEAIVQMPIIFYDNTKKFPPKLKDLGNLAIPYTIGNSYLEKAPCDLSASINLMPETE